MLPLLDRPGFLSSKTGTDDIFNFIYIIMYIYIYIETDQFYDDVRMMLNYYNVFQAKLKAEKLQIPKKTSQHLPIKSLLDSFVTAWHVLSRLFFSFQAR